MRIHIVNHDDRFRKNKKKITKLVGKAKSEESRKRQGVPPFRGTYVTEVERKHPPLKRSF